MVIWVHSYKKFWQSFWGCMALFLFNISVDTVDPYPNFISEDLSINDQESVVEIIVEQVLGFEDAIVEYDDHDTGNHNKKTNFKIETTTNSSVESCNPKRFPDYRIRKFSELKFFENFGHTQLETPPPENCFV